MGRAVLSEEAYRRVSTRVEKSGGSATHEGEQRHKKGLGLDPLVDPKGYDVIRRSISWMEPRGKNFELLRGVAMLVEQLVDTTGSMGHNVDVIFRVLPRLYNLLATGDQAVLKRYDTQIINSIFGDAQDNYILCRSQAEIDERIAEQLTLMVPERAGGDMPEDPQYGLFGAAFLTKAVINDYGLKSYHFLVTDAPGRARLDSKNLVRVFGDSVWEKVAENGFQITSKDLPTTKEVVEELLERTHAFMLQVDNDQSTKRFWEQMYGSERLVRIPSTEQLPEVIATIIGLTEGTTDLQSAHELIGIQTKEKVRDQVIRAVAGIPMGAQANLPGFKDLPLRGSIFAKKGDLRPMEDNKKSPSQTKPSSGKNKKPKIDWD